ncbi:MAG: hypothetical protein HC915_20465 [Anaerolineae bacterium]|nr:hypothetical protein [Anaerolineae bacterium]
MRAGAQATTDDTLTAGEVHHLAVAQHLQAVYGAEIAAVVRREPGAVAGLEAALAAGLAGLKVEEVRLLANDAVLFSTDAAQIGGQASQTPGYVAAWRRGETTSTLQAGGLDTSLPLFMPPQQDAVAVLNLRSNVSVLQADLRAHQQVFLLNSGLLAVVALLLLGLVILYGDIRLREQRRVLEDQNSRLMLQLISRATSAI